MSKKVEYFLDLIESQFVAVFKPIGLSTFPDQLDYCISAGKNHYKIVDVTYENIEDQQLTKSLLETILYKIDDELNFYHSEKD